MLNKFLFKTFFISLLICAFFVFFSSKADAQQCSGTISCCTSYNKQCNLNGVPASCDPNTDPGCKCVNTTCANTQTKSCKDLLSPPDCDSLPAFPPCQGGFSGNCGNPVISQCPSGQSMCGGCINACRDTSTLNCNQWIFAECSGSGGGGTGGGGGGGVPSCGNCSGCGQPDNLCIDFGDGKGCVIGSFCGGGGGSCSSNVDPRNLVLHVGETKDATMSFNDGIFDTHISSYNWGYANTVPSVPAITAYVADQGFYDSGGVSNPWKIIRVTGINVGTADISMVGKIDGSDGREINNPDAGYPVCGINGIRVTVLPPSCKVTIPDLTVNKGLTQPVSPTISVFSGSVTGVSYVVYNPFVPTYATISPNNTNTSPYTTNVTGVTEGSVRYQANVSMSDGTICGGSGNITVINPPGWWQVNGGDAITNGGLQSLVPGTSSVTKFIQNAGNAIYGSNTNLTNTTVSDNGWIAKTNYLGKTYDYSYFLDLASSRTTLGSVADINGLSDITSHAAFSDGYVYLQKSSGTLNINNDLNIGNNKVVIFAGDKVFIKGNISVTPGRGFLIIISKGDINVDKSVTNIAGIYETDGRFDTDVNGVSTLNIKGSVVAWGGVNLGRDLGPANSTTASENITFDPTLAVLFPRTLTRDNVSWQEVLP